MEQMTRENTEMALEIKEMGFNINPQHLEIIQNQNNAESSNNMFLLFKRNYSKQPKIESRVKNLVGNKSVDATAKRMPQVIL